MALSGFLLACRTTDTPGTVKTSANISVPESAAPKATNYVVITRNNCLSLLHDLLGDEKNVSKLLIIKHDGKEFNELIKHISSVSGVAVRSLEEMAKADPTIDLKQSNLPPGDKAAREAQSKATAKELLRSSGDDFEFALLLAQAEALNYSRHLAKVAAANAPNQDQRNQLTNLSNQFGRLHSDVLRMLHPASASRR